jgi:hypothetical protein
VVGIGVGLRLGPEPRPRLGLGFALTPIGVVCVAVGGLGRAGVLFARVAGPHASRWELRGLWLLVFAAFVCALVFWNVSRKVSSSESFTEVSSGPNLARSAWSSLWEAICGFFLAQDAAGTTEG